MIPEHNPPKDPSLAETTVLPRVGPRFPTDRDLRPMTGEEVLTTGDWWGFSDSEMPLSKVSGLAGNTVAKESSDCETFVAFRPIAPAPQATEPKADPEAMILANINMDPNVSEEFKSAMFAAVRGAYAKAVEIEAQALAPVDPEDCTHPNATMVCPDCDPIFRKAPSPVLGDATAVELIDALEHAVRDGEDLKGDSSHLVDAKLAILSRLSKVQALMEAVAQAREALECVQALDMPHGEGRIILERHGHDYSQRFDLPPSKWVAAKVTATIASLVSIIQPDGGVK